MQKSGQIFMNTSLDKSSMAKKRILQKNFPQLFTISYDSKRFNLYTGRGYTTEFWSRDNLDLN